MKFTNFNCRNVIFTVAILVSVIAASILIFQKSGTVQKEILAQQEWITLPHLPIPTGPYRVGITTYDLNDEWRKEIQHPDGRLIPIMIYFPIQKGKHVLHKKVFEDRAQIFKPDLNVPLDVGVFSNPRADLQSLQKMDPRPVIILNHGNTVAMTDYAWLAEDLASNGYVVVAIQHQLKTDPEYPEFWERRSVSRWARCIDNMLYVFEWLKANNEKEFYGKLDLKRLGLLGHSQGAHTLMLFANRASYRHEDPLLPHDDPKNVNECIVALDPLGFPYPRHTSYPILMIFSEKHEEEHKQTGTYKDMQQAGHTIIYYKGATHISFMDHGYINPPNPVYPKIQFFNGTVEERKAFFDTMRADIRTFLLEHGV